MNVPPTKESGMALYALEESEKENEKLRAELDALRARVDSACEALADEDAAFVRTALERPE